MDKTALIKSMLSLPDLKLIKSDIKTKVAEQGKPNILKAIPEKIAPENLSQTPQKTAPQKPADLKLKELAVQFFAKNSPFEGFAKLADTLSLNSTFLNPTKQNANQDSSLSSNIKNNNLNSELTNTNLTETTSTILDSKSDIKTAIKNLLLLVSLKSEKVDINFLPKLIEKSGMLMERKLADIIQNGSLSLSESQSYLEQKSDQPKSLPNFAANFVKDDIKGAILNFIAESTSKESFSSESLQDIKVFQEFIQNLENVQILNSHISESGKYIIALPMFASDMFSFGQLLIDLGQKDKDDDNPSSKENSLLKVSLLLDMTNLGPIRADFSILKDNITGGFQVNSEEIADFFNLMLPELKERLLAHGYNVHKIECRAVEPEKLAEKSLINEIIKSEDHNFSVMI
ncbi:MAG: flagellar hook-length control protein FliK [Desulfamplus sp.]|nr:flagellar hook-length control protein FliK [Desulfamplus sp.]